MQTFDHETAWDQVAKPAFDALPAELKELFEAVKFQAADLAQLKNLEMPWPDTDLKARFEAVPNLALARAARIIHNYGHWGYTSEGRAAQAHGSYWKFAHYADQVLRARLKVPHSDNPKDIGISVRIVEGVVRVCISAPGSWTWQEVGLATEETLRFIEAAPGRPRDPRPGGSSARRVSRELWMHYVADAEEWLFRLINRLIGEYPELRGEETLAINTGRFMVDEAVVKARNEARQDVARAMRDERFLSENPFAFGRYAAAIVAAVDAFPAPADAYNVVWHLLLKIRLADVNKARLLDKVAEQRPDFVTDYRKREEERKARTAKLLTEPRPS